MKVKMTYYVVYQTEKGFSNTIVQTDGPIGHIGQLQTICKQLAEKDGVELVNIVNWRHLPAHDEITDEDEVQ